MQLSWFSGPARVGLCVGALCGAAWPAPVVAPGRPAAARAARAAAALALAREVFVMYGVDGLRPAGGGGAADGAAADSTAAPEVASRLAAFGAVALGPVFPHFEPRTLRARDGRLVRGADMSRLMRYRLPDGARAAELAAALRGQPGVLYAHVNGLTAPCVVPNDSLYRWGYQWSLSDTTLTSGHAEGIRASAAWQHTTGSVATTIGIMDSGVSATHPDLAGRVTGDVGVAADEPDHGSHVAGIAAANTNTTPPFGMAGIDWHALILAERLGDGDDDIYRGIQAALASGADILNCSWRLVNWQDEPRYSDTVRGAFADAYRLNRICTVSMGNEQIFQPNIVNFPAAFGQGIVAVGASDRWGLIAGFSNHGPHIDLAAPGVAIMSCVRDDPPGTPAYAFFSGTSMAAPHVAGVAGLLLALRPDLANDDVEQIVRLSARDVPPAGFDPASGCGLLDAGAAVDRLRAPWSLAHERGLGGTEHAVSGWYMQGYLAGAGPADATFLSRRHEVRRAVTFAQAFSAPPNVWGRGAETVGFSADNPCWGMGWCEVVPGSITPTGCTLRTYVYEARNINGTPLGWFPTAPTQAVFAWSVLGRDAATGVSEPAPPRPVLCRAQPNPATDVVRFMPAPGVGRPWRLVLHDARGRLVRAWTAEDAPPGGGPLVWDRRDTAGRRAPAGVYFYRFAAPGGESVGKVSVVR